MFETFILIFIKNEYYFIGTIMVKSMKYYFIGTITVSSM